MATKKKARLLYRKHEKALKSIQGWKVTKITEYKSGKTTKEYRAEKGIVTMWALTLTSLRHKISAKQKLEKFGRKYKG